MNDRLLRLEHLCLNETEDDVFAAQGEPVEWMRDESIWALVCASGVWYFGPDLGDGNTHHFTLPDLGEDAAAALDAALAHLETAPTT